MKKVAFFVEGQTEQIFLNRLVKEVLGNQDTSIILKRSRGGSSIPRVEITRGMSLARNPKYQVLIYDCGADNRVKTEILDNIRNLEQSGYDYIVGIRDLYPMPIDDLPLLERGLKYLPKKIYNEFRKKPENPLDFIVVVQEIETWFLAEAKHFLKVDKRLTENFIKRNLGFDPYHENAMTRKHPAKDLDNIYRLVGKSYTKKYWQVEKLVNRLDYNNLRHNLKHEIPSLNEIIGILEKIK